MPYLIGAERRAVATGKHLPCLKLPSKFDLVTIRKRFRSTFFLSSSRSPFVNFLLLANDDPLVTLVETVGHSLNETVIFFPYSIERNLSRFDREKKKKKFRFTFRAYFLRIGNFMPAAREPVALIRV